MHNDFADWYRLVHIDPQPDQLDLRWKGVIAATKKISTTNALDLVRLFLNKAPKATQFESEFKSTFKTIDNTFPMRDNALELQLLAGATIINILESGDENLGDLLTLAISCGDFQGLSPRTVLAELIDLAMTNLHGRSENLRSALPTPSIDDLPDVSLPDATTTESANPVAWNLIAPVIETLEEQNEGLAEQTNKGFRNFAFELKLLREETNMLWWLFGGYSHDTKKALGELEMPAASLVMGKELADLTLVLPGPIAAEAFLDRMLQLSKKSKTKTGTIRQALGLPIIAAWKRESTKNLNLDSVGDVCFIHQAIKQSANSESEAEWTASYKKCSGVDVETELAPSILALQVYRERLLFRALS